MDISRIATLLEPFLETSLAPSQLAQISTYIDLLLRWNARINLTAIRDPDEIVTRHFGESLFLARHLFPEAGSVTGRDRSELRASRSQRIFDLGSGAGFPGLPIKIWAPDTHLTLVESNHRKAAFLREVARTLTLMNVDVITERAEAVAARVVDRTEVRATGKQSTAPLRATSAAARQSDVDAALQALTDGGFDAERPGPRASTPTGSTPGAPMAAMSIAPPDVVTFRAVERFDQILHVAASFLTSGSRLAVLIGSAQQAELGQISRIEWMYKHVPQSHTRLLSIGVRT